MVQETINRMCKYLEFYDKHGYFPFDKKRIDITISFESLEKLNGKNKSEEINNLILNNL